MALKNSKTGSLPVSEIYNFMTEHFPYFKTAPDGWKNSVRHNLSLNKCFEKVENKSGSSSRKGCLWALNPSKIDKMQEELDAINPSLTDFDFQGNLWEQLKDDSLALDPLVLVTSSPTSSSMLPPPPPAHCFPPGPCLSETGNGASELAPPGNGGSGALGDLHLSTLYSAFVELDPTPSSAAPGPAVYLSPGSKPMALA